MIVLLIAATLRMSIPYILASTGGAYSVRAGITDLGCEGMMIGGAFFGVMGSYFSGNPWIGLLCGMFAGMAFAMLNGVLHINFKVNPAISGVCINLLSTALAPLLIKLVWDNESMSPLVKGFKSFAGTWVEKIPVVGPILATQNIMFFLTLGLVVIAWGFLFKTKFGLRLRMVGEDPVAASTVGLNTKAYKFTGQLVCGAMSGLAGVYLSLAQLNLFTEGMTAGRGYICMVINVIAGYNPLGAIWGGCFFAFFEALRTVVQNAAINANFLMMIPYVMTLVAIVISARRVLPPAGMGKHHDD